MALEDPTGSNYTEEDTGNYLTATSTQVSIASVPRNAKSWFLRSNYSFATTQNVELRFIGNFTASDNNGTAGLVGFSNVAKGITKTSDDNDDGLFVFFWDNAGRLYLQEVYGGSKQNSYATLSFGTDYYCTLELNRAGGSYGQATLTIRTTSHTNDPAVATLGPMSLNLKIAYQNFLFSMSAERSSGTEAATATVRDVEFITPAFEVILEPTVLEAEVEILDASLAIASVVTLEPTVLEAEIELIDPTLVVATAGTVTITSPVQYQMLQRDGSDQADIDVTGTYTGTPTGIDARFNAGSWETIEASPSGGTFSGTLSNMSAGQGEVEVRFTTNFSVTDVASTVGIGDIFIVAGDSNASGRGSNNQSYSHASLVATLYDEDDAWRELTDPSDTEANAGGSIWPLLATLVMAETGYPVAFITVAEGGTKLYQSTWAAGGSRHNLVATQFSSCGANDVKAILWHQSGQDIVGSVSTVDYKTELSASVDDWQTDLSLSTLKLVCSRHASPKTGNYPRSQNDAIRLAHVQIADEDSDILWGPSSYDIDLGEGVGTDDKHFKTDAHLQAMANRWWRALYFHFYSGSEDRGPQYSNSWYSGSTVNVLFTGGEGDMQNGTDDTGWRVVDNNGVRTVQSATQIGHTISVELDQALVGPVEVSFGSTYDGAGATLSDSGTYTLPPEFFLSEEATSVAPSITFATTVLEVEVDIQDATLAIASGDAFAYTGRPVLEQHYNIVVDKLGT